MSLAFVYPAALAALAALALPLLIHLARRQQHTPLPFAALRWLQRSARPRRRIRIDEWLLLALRLALVAVLAVLLARPQWLGGADDASAVIAIAPGIDPGQLPADLPADARRLWLANGFPDTRQPPPAAVQPLPSLLRELDAQLTAATPLTVVVPARIRSADGQVPRLARAVDWRVVPLPESTDEPAQPPAPPRLVIRHDAAASGVAQLAALQRAWHPDAAPDIGPDTAPLPAPQAGDWLVWLSARALPATAAQWPGVIVDARQPLPDAARPRTRLHDGQGNVLLEQPDPARPQWLRLAAPVQPAASPLWLDPRLPQALQQALQAPRTPRHADAIDYTPQLGAQLPPPSPRELSPWLIALAALLFALERWLASSPRRRLA